MEKASPRKFPMRGIAGGFLVVVFWTINWAGDGLRTHLGFFPLWLGYVLVLDSLVFWRKGSSLYSRSIKRFLGLFLTSIPVWWLFELFNVRLQNWFYQGREYFSALEYGILASLSFSTVIPAVFEAAELIGTFQWINRYRNGIRLKPSNKTAIIFAIIGAVQVCLTLVWPRYFFYFVWSSVYFLVEAVNIRKGYRSLLSFTQKGDWRPAVALWVGVLLCGFFWEMWNFYSYPKWIYRVPLVDFWHIFEMPVLGYTGYLPFSLELFAIYHLISGLFKVDESYVMLVDEVTNAQLPDSEG